MPMESKAAEQMKADVLNACKGGDDKTVERIVRGNVGDLTAKDLGEALIITRHSHTINLDGIALLLIDVHALSLTHTQTITHTFRHTYIQIQTEIHISINNRMELTSI
jgi:hypothetical protein